MKKEELHRHTNFTAEELIQSVEEYIHFFNCERPHHRLKARTPEQVETDYYAGNLTNTSLQVIKNEGMFCTFSKKKLQKLTFVSDVRAT